MKKTQDYNLEITCPKLVSEWSDKNDLNPKDYTPSSTKKVWWKCKKGHEWQAMIGDRKKGSGCPFCAGQRPSPNYNLAIICPELALEWSDRNELKPENYMPNSNKKVWWKCKNNNHEWQAMIGNRKKGSGCPYCAGQIPYSTYYNLVTICPELVSEWSDKNELKPENYTPNSAKKVWWKCKKNHKWKASINSRKNGSGCPYCAGQRPSPDYNLAIICPELALEWSDKNELKPADYTPSPTKKVWWKCKNGHEWKATINSRKNGKGCPYCSKTISKAGTDWLDECWLIANIKSTEYRIEIDGKNYIADGVCTFTKTIYEFLGNYWHGNPKLYDKDDINKNNKKTFGELFQQTQKRFRLLNKKGWTIVYKWESDINMRIFNGKNLEY